MRLASARGGQASIVMFFKTLEGAHRCGFRYFYDSSEGIVVVKTVEARKIRGIVLVENPGQALLKLPRHQPPSLRERFRTQHEKINRPAFKTPARWIP